MVKALGIILFVQILIVTMIWINSGTEAGEDPRLLLALPEESITRFNITDDANSTLTMEKHGDAWQLSSKLPVDVEKVDRVLKNLFTTEVSWPTANSGSAASRFEVAADKYQRRLELNSAEGDTTIFLGTSPGFRQSHVRVAGETEIYTIEFANFEVSTNENEWFDKGLLQPTGELVSVQKHSSWTLSSSPEGWLVDNQEGDFAAVTDILNRLRTLRVDNVIENATEKVAEVLLGLRVVDADGEYLLEIGMFEEDQYWVRSSRQEKVFGIAAYIAQALEVDKEALALQFEQN